jgi:N-acetylglucosamine-6-phosphate deacetylase
MVENSQNISGFVIEAEKVVSIHCGTLTPGFITVSANGLIVHVGNIPREEDKNLEVKKAKVVLPGLVDIHNHGYGGADNLEDHWTNPSYTLEKLAMHGTTSVLASIMFPANKLDSINEMCKNLVKNWVGK